MKNDEKQLENYVVEFREYDPQVEWSPWMKLRNTPFNTYLSARSAAKRLSSPTIEVKVIKVNF